MLWKFLKTFRSRLTEKYLSTNSPHTMDSSRPVTLQQSADIAQQVARNAFSQAMMQNICFGVGNTFRGVRNIAFGDNLEIFGDYQVVIGNSVTLAPWKSEADRDLQLKAHQDYLKMFENLDASGLCPKTFFPEAKAALQTIICLIRSVGVKVSAAPAEEETGPKIEPVVDEPTTMKVEGK